MKPSEDAAASAPATQSVLRAAGVVGAATLVSRILGLVREQVLAFFFGAGDATDAFNIAFRIPNLLRNLFAEGAMSASLIPTFTQIRGDHGEKRAWRLAGLVFRTLLVGVGGLALLGVLFAPELVGLYAGGFRGVPGKFDLTVKMTQVMFPYFPLVALAAAFTGVLNACGLFFLPALSSALFNVTSVLVGVALALVFPRFGLEPILGMAWGVVLGGLAQAFFQLPILYRAGYRWESGADLPGWRQDPGLRRIFLMMGPGVVGMAATQVSMLVNSILATSQAPGAVSWLTYAFRLMQFPIGLFGVSLATAVLPRVSELRVKKDWEGIRASLEESLKHVFAVNLPASAALAFLGFPLVQLLFQYGRFGADDALATAQALGAYAVGLSAYAVTKILVPSCYALGNTRIPVISSVLTVALTIVLNLALIGPLGFVGLALGTSVAALLNAVFLFYAFQRLLRREGGEFPGGPLLRSFLVHLSIALVMGWLCSQASGVLVQWIPEDSLQLALGRAGVPLVRVFRVSLLIVLGGGVVLAAAKMLNLRETAQIVDLFTRKLKKKLSRKEN